MIVFVKQHFQLALFSVGVYMHNAVGLLQVDIGNADQSAISGCHFLPR
jgi:hypothetical protein